MPVGARQLLLVLALVVGGIGPLSALSISDRYRSPRNGDRKVRASTELIVLHTTEAPARSALNKLCERGECHFCVTENGSIYRIVDRDKEAFHAGRSMWRGREDADKYSIGIECVGYHDKAMNAVQLEAIRKLLVELKRDYRLSDDKVITHGHVAYGAPNRWHKCRHRGRKRCGMLFAMPSVRKQLGLKSRPATDADVKAKRLVVGDAYLNQVLYGNVDTMKAVYASAKPPPADGVMGWFRQPAAKGTSDKSAATPKASAKTTPPKSAAKTKSAAKAQPAAKTQSAPRNEAELKAQGYRLLGTVSGKVTASRLAGKQWNKADTYYTIRNKVIPGNRIDPAKIEKGMKVWRK